MPNIDQIFKIPNTQQNYEFRDRAIRIYKMAHNIPEKRGVNVAEVIKWLKEQYKED